MLLTLANVCPQSSRFFFITFTHEGAVWYYKANALLKLLVFIGI